MSTRNQLLAPPSGGKIGPIKTAIIRESADLKIIESSKIREIGPIDLERGVQRNLIHDNNLDIFNPYL